jgi:hypothetical protein
MTRKNFIMTNHTLVNTHRRQLIAERLFIQTIETTLIRPAPTLTDSISVGQYEGSDTSRLNSKLHKGP